MIFRKVLFSAILLTIILNSNLLFLWGENFPNIALEEYLSIGSLEDDMLFQWAGVVVDSQGYIFVTDTMDFTLKKFDVQGKLIKKAGRRGQGPGEFLAPRLLDCSEKFIYVTDQYIPGIQIFDKQLNFERHLPLTIPIVDLKVLSDDFIAVATFALEKTGKIFIFDSRGKAKSEIVFSREKSPLMMDMVSFDFDSQSNLYLAYVFQDRIEKFDKDGNKLWAQKLLGGKKVKKNKVSSYEVPTETIYKDVAIDRSGNLFVLGGDFSKNNSSDVYVLNSHGKLLTTFTLPDSSHCIYFDNQNFFYSRANEGVTLKKFRMKYSDKY